MIRTLALATALLAPIVAVAQDLPTAPYLPLDMAQTAARAALDACVAQGHNVSVAIVARSGVTTVVCARIMPGRIPWAAASARPSPLLAWAATPQISPGSSERTPRTRDCATWTIGWWSRLAACQSASAVRWLAAWVSAAPLPATSMRPARAPDLTRSAPNSSSMDETAGRCLPDKDGRPFAGGSR